MHGADRDTSDFKNKKEKERRGTIPVPDGIEQKQPPDALGDT